MLTEGPIKQWKWGVHNPISLNNFILKQLVKLFAL